MNLLISAPLCIDGDSLDKTAIQAIQNGLAEFEGEIVLSERNIGHGADWTVLLVTLGGIFLLGEKIQKNLDAWIAVAQRVVKLFDWLKEKFGLARVDESGAIAIAINDIVLEQKKVTALRLEAIQTVSFTPVPWNPLDRLDGKPDALYVYGVKSKGTVEFKHRYPVFWGDF